MLNYLTRNNCGAMNSLRSIRNENIVKILFETTPDMLTILDKDGKILDCNHHFTENFGYDKSEAIGKIGPIDMVSYGDRQKAASAFGQLLTDGIKLNVPLEVMRKDKSTFPSIWSGAKLSDELGNLEGYLITGKDLTDIQKLEDELKEKDQKLILIGDMTTRIAHDIRNPLHVIINSAKLLEIQLENSPNESMSKRLTLILKSAERIKRQVEDVMGYVGVKPLNLIDCSVFDLIVSSIEHVIIPNNIQISYTRDDDIRISCDKNNLNAVFGNLILNSIQAIGENKGTITIDWKVDYDHVVINFMDSGPGIPEEIMPKIFDPFFTTKPMGTGLGLVNCKKIIEQHNGKVSARNNPTTFTVVLPVK